MSFKKIVVLFLSLSLFIVACGKDQKDTTEGVVSSSKAASTGSSGGSKRSDVTGEFLGSCKLYNNVACLNIYFSKNAELVFDYVKEVMSDSCRDQQGYFREDVKCDESHAVASCFFSKEDNGVKVEIDTLFNGNADLNFLRQIKKECDEINGTFLRRK